MADPATTSSSLTRRSFLKTAAAAGAAIAAPGLLSLTAEASRGATRRNLIFFLTDQERATRWFPPGWEEANMPGLMRMKRTGVTFTNACVNTAMCTPSRSSIFTGTYPPQNGCTDTLTEGFAQSATEFQLNPNLPNLATILKDGGYDVFYKGKWHLSTAVHDANGELVNDDLSRYGFDGWNPPDAGQDTKTENYGGGNANHDERFFNDALDFLRERMADTTPNPRPFCLIISLVNPHDVLGYPGLGTDDNWRNGGGYSFSDLEGNIELPPTVDEDLRHNYKPTAHAELLPILAGLGILQPEIRKRNYCNFYGNLLKMNDQKMVELLDLLEGSPEGMKLRRNTWIVRTSDHGEMGMAHGGLRQKNFQCYEENLRIPLVWSNIEEFPEGRGLECPHLVSHVDFLPTLCGTLLGLRDWKRRYNLSGFDYSALLKNPKAARGVQDYVLFTYDDIYAAGDVAVFGEDGMIPPPNRLRGIRTREYKYVRYFDGRDIPNPEPDQEEFYDLRTTTEGGTDTDSATGLPKEYINYSDWAQQQRILDGKSPLVIPVAIERQKATLKRLLTLAERDLQPRPLGPVLPYEVNQEVVTVDDQPVLQLFWYSQIMLEYQLQKKEAGGAWVDLNDPIPGNNGPILLVIDDYDPTSEYRIIDSAA